MDGISFLDAILIYSVLFLPIVTMILLFVWGAANMKNSSKVQLLVVILVFILGILAINSIILPIMSVSMVLLFIWIYLNKNGFAQGQLLFIFIVFGFQILFYFLWFLVLDLETTLAFIILLVAPIATMGLLFPWTFGRKNTLAKGQLIVVIAFILQVILLILCVFFWITALK
ncbi:hypothetical protein I6J18_04815 [Peribacillus psychrosaccharolyticus]|uniref:Uncharacterized protein n=1 Tax=Peribacillus psychrosaccharolyticus TaxID=1407 RepID=A0A974NP52_PERPY|nr:hypothetical protein [Peribacillus psychrosaccharolyticus]MEC2054151.1 hypothetical protein [Peribacillus psychrosaccharolyticus]MED3742231.1 hypothetical protein [Peribacillus psychrosaccharolyticus]QQT01215.1 hypothetical protein I6J18_04815 [Peribacillus psychrosaccharolyticus]